MAAADDVITCSQDPAPSKGIHVQFSSRFMALYKVGFSVPITLHIFVTYS